MTAAGPMSGAAAAGMREGDGSGPASPRAGGAGPARVPRVPPSRAALRREGEISTRLRAALWHWPPPPLPQQVFPAPGSPLAGAGVFIILQCYSKALCGDRGLALRAQSVLPAASRALRAPVEPGVRRFSQSATCLDVKIHLLQSTPCRRPSASSECSAS